MKITQMQRRITTAAAPLAAFFRERIHIPKDPSDPVFQQRYTEEMIDGFRLLSLLVFATASALFLVFIMQMGVRTAYPYEALSPWPAHFLLLQVALGCSPRSRFGLLLPPCWRRPPCLLPPVLC